jgi:hypothetical protein
MKKKICYQCGILLLLLVLVVSVTGCKQQAAVEETDSTTGASVYTGALRTDYENALDVTSQLALGVLRLEDTTNAVTAEQAVQTLPVWKTLQNIGVSAQSERLAVTKQLEGLLSETQVTAIVSMQLTEADAQAWLQEQGPIAEVRGGQMPSGGAGTQGQGNAPAMSDEDRAAMREQFQNMTEEERANMQAQFGQGNGTSSGAAPSGGNAPAGGFAGMTTGVATMLTRSVISLLTERSGQSAVAAAPSIETGTTPSATESTEPASAATAAPEPETDTSVVPIITLVPWSTPEPEATPTPEATQAATTAAVAAATAAASTTTPASAQSVAADSSPASPPVGGSEGGGALEQKLDTDPGPPLTIQITTNTSEANPLLEGGSIYRVGGFVYNPTDETYQVTAVHVTFFDASGFRGAFYAFPRKAGERPGGEWIAHGAVEAQVSCEVLGPGESCPFVAEIAGQDMASFLVHPDAKVAEWHESVGVTLSNTKISDTGTSYVRVSGTATNPYVYAVKNVIISALLLDDSGQTMSMGTGVVTSLAAGASTNFEIYVEKKAYTSYELHARAEQVVN